jgi:hypothetical protein
VQSDGQATFTATNQHYFQYSGAELGADGILSSQETSAAQNWVLNVPASVTSFSFQLFVAADVRYPDGWVQVTPGVDSLLAGSTQALLDSVFTVSGNFVSTGASSWGRATRAWRRWTARGT